MTAVALFFCPHPTSHFDRKSNFESLIVLLNSANLIQSWIDMQLWLKLGIIILAEEAFSFTKLQNVVSTRYII